MSEIVELTAAAAAERVRAGELSPGELWDAYRERAAGDSLNAFLWRADEAPDVPALLTIEGLDVFYGGIHALRDVSLTVNSGEVVKEAGRA